MSTGYVDEVDETEATSPRNRHTNPILDAFLLLPCCSCNISREHTSGMSSPSSIPCLRLIGVCHGYDFFKPSLEFLMDTFEEDL